MFARDRLRDEILRKWEVIEDKTSMGEHAWDSFKTFLRSEWEDESSGSDGGGRPMSERKTVVFGPGSNKRREVQRERKRRNHKARRAGRRHERN